MGMFDLFKKKSGPRADDKELARLQKMVSNKLSQNLDREDALRRLVQMASPAAARVLLSRFNWNLDPSIKDNEEKELAVSGIVAAGAPALDVIREYCPKATSLTWPLKALRGIVSRHQIEGELLALVDEFDTEYVRNPEPKIQLLQVLSEFHSEDVRTAVQPFLTDMCEEVRFAAVTTVLACGSAEALDSLIEALNAEESLRVKNRIATGLVEQGWVLSPTLVERATGKFPPGFAVRDGILAGAARA